MALPTKKQLRDKLGIRGTPLHLLYHLMQMEVNSKLRSGDSHKVVYATNRKLCDELICCKRTISYARNTISSRGWVKIDVDQNRRQSYFIILWDRLGPELGISQEIIAPPPSETCTPAVEELHPSGEEVAPPLPIISSIKSKNKKKEEEAAATTTLFGDDLPEKQNQFIPSEYEKKILIVLQGIYKYPFDRDDDVKTIRALAAKYPTVDIEACAMKMAAEYLDVAITKKSRPRRKLLTYVSNAFKWGTDQLPEKPRSMEPQKSPLAEGRGYAAPPEAEPGRFVDMAKRKGKKK